MPRSNKLNASTAVNRLNVTLGKTELRPLVLLTDAVI